MRFLVVEDQRRTPETVRTRRHRLARVLNHVRHLKQQIRDTEKQGRRVVGWKSPKPGGAITNWDTPDQWSPKTKHRFSVLSQRYGGALDRLDKHQKAYDKRAGPRTTSDTFTRLLKAAHHGKTAPMRWQVGKSARLDLPQRPANPKTYGRGDPIANQVSKAGGWSSKHPYGDRAIRDKPRLTWGEWQRQRQRR